MSDEGMEEGMKLRDACEKFEANLAFYLEGDSDPEMLSHASECDFCRCLLADLDLIRKVSTELGMEEPPARVWANVRAVLIEEGIVHDPVSFWRRWVPRRGRSFVRHPAPLAAAAVAVVMAVVLFKAPGYLVRSGTPPANVIHMAVFSQDYMAPRDISSLRATIQQLEQAYQANETSLEPSMKATYQKSLDSLNDEIRECELSMKQQPENDLAREYLSTAYVQKAELLQSALEYNLR